MKFWKKSEGRIQKIIVMLMVLILTTSLLNNLQHVSAEEEIVTAPINSVMAVDAGYLNTTKTAELVNAADRTYEIDITAAAIGSEAQVTEAKNDIVLVLDRSGSMAFPYNPTIATDWITNKEYFLSSDGGSSYILVRLLSHNGYYGYYYNNRWNYIYSGDVLYQKTSTRMEVLKDSVKTFMAELETQAPDTRICVTSFSGNGYYWYDYWKNEHWVRGTDNASNDSDGFKLVSDSQQYLDLITAVDGLEPKGETRIDDGMKMAYNLLNTNSIINNGRKKSVIAFTDGVPTGWDDGNSYSETVANRALDEASDIEDLGATVYSIGLLDGLSYIEKGQARTFLTNLASFKSNLVDKHFYEMSQGYDILDAFQDISQEILNKIEGATVRDYIDSRFELTSDSVVALMADGATIGVDSISGLQYVQWMGETIPNEENGNWSKSFQIKAKDDFVGGNAVPTNGEASGIYLPAEGGGEELIETLPRPTVNIAVTEKSFELDDVVFYGDKLQLSEMAAKVKEVLETNPGGDAKIQASVNELIVDSEVDYMYSGTTDILGKLKILVDTEDSEFDSLLNPEGKTYTVKVIFIPLPIIERDIPNDYVLPGVNSGAILSGDQTVDVATYAIEVIKGEMTIKKTIDNQYTNKEQPKSNQSFVYKIERFSDEALTNREAEFYEVISFSANDSVTIKEAKIKGLQKGYYKVTQEDSWSWKYDNVAINDSDSFWGDTEDGVVFIGNKTEVNGTHFFGQEGESNPYKADVGFTGEIKNGFKTWMSDVASAIFK